MSAHDQEGEQRCRPLLPTISLLPPPPSNPTKKDLLANLTADVQRLLSELSQFQAFLRDQDKVNLVEIRAFRSSVAAEGRALERLGERVERDGDGMGQGLGQDEKDEAGSRSGERGWSKGVHGNMQVFSKCFEINGHRDMAEPRLETSLHALRSSNLPFLSTVWHIAKQCRGLKALSKRYYFSSNPKCPNALGDNLNGHSTAGNGSVKPLERADHGRRTQASVLVDIVSSDGSLWTKVSLVNEKRLIYDMAKEGYGIDGDEDKEASSGPTDMDLEIIRLASDLRAASRVAPRVNYRHPRVRLVLPRLSEHGGGLSQIRPILTKIRSMDVEVICKEQLDTLSTLPAEIFSAQSAALSEHPPSSSSSSPSSSLQPSASTSSSSTSTSSSLLPHLAPSYSTHASLPNDPSNLTPTLNLDCTILLALVSDISHLTPSRLLPLPKHLQERGDGNNNNRNTFHAAIRAQIAAEAQSQGQTPPSPTSLHDHDHNHEPAKQPPNPKKDTRFLPTQLYPILTPSRPLITTLEAATRMAEIVRTIGTVRERQRVAGFFGGAFDLLNPCLSPPLPSEHQPESDAASENATCHALLSHPALTDFAIPPSLRLPIRVVAAVGDQSGARTRLAPYARSLAAAPLRLSPINAAVFLTGWARGVTTVTSNRVVARAVERAVCERLDSAVDVDVDEDEGGQRRNWDFGPKMWILGRSRSLIGKEKRIDGGGGEERDKEEGFGE